MAIGRVVLASLMVAMLAGDALAQQAYVYPSQGQSPEQQNKDQGECHVWAVQQTGYDPYGATGTAPSGGVIRGAAGGAALGAVGGAIAGDAGKGAAIGAATGALFGGLRQHRQRRQQDTQTQQSQDAYSRAFAACMSARGYSVQ